MRRSSLLVYSALSLAGMLVAVGFVLASRTDAHPAPGVDPGLVLHPRTVAVTASVPEIGTIRLRVYPAIPGPQHVAVFLPQQLHPPTIALRAEMPGMMMRPSMSTVARHGIVYRGTLDLPMFGAYQVQIRMTHRQPIALRVVLPLTIGH